MSQNTFSIKGNIYYSIDKDHLEYVPNGYLVCEENKVKGVFKELPEEYKELPLKDYMNQMILPGFVDLHLHGPQYSYTGLGLDLELLHWLEEYTFPEEAKYEDLNYARKAYEIFTEDLRKSPTTRACIFGTIHKNSTILLMELLDKTGLKTMVGKVNMDRNSPTILCEKDALESEKETRDWLEEVMDRFENVQPILTPRFIPSCSDQLMERLAIVQKEYQLPVQSHLSENMEEIKWVRDLRPDSTSYGDAYLKSGMFQEQSKVIMAHCVYSEEEEINLLKKYNAFIAHCPQSNVNLSSGIAPIRKYLDKGLLVGLGTDIGAGASLSMFRAIVDTIKVSKIYWRLKDISMKPITVEEAFYMATKGGGDFFGKVGSFLKGYEFDAVVIDDSRIPSVRELSGKERLERVLYHGDDRDIKAKYVAGTLIF